MTNREFFIKTWESDAAKTAKAIRALPNDMSKLNHQHHASFRSPWQLINHIGPHGKEVAQAISQGRMDLVNEGWFDMSAPHIYKNTEQAAKDVEANTAALIAAAKKVDDATWESKIVPVYWGPNKIFEMPMGDLAWTMLHDTLHHRGQLTSYYRTLGVTQPNVMGPTYEEEMAMMATAAN